MLGLSRRRFLGRAPTGLGALIPFGGRHFVDKTFVMEERSGDGTTIRYRRFCCEQWLDDGDRLPHRSPPCETSGVLSSEVPHLAAVY